MSANNSLACDKGQWQHSVVAGWMEVSTLQFLSCLQHTQVLMPRREAGSSGSVTVRAALPWPCLSYGERVSSGWRRDGAACGAASGRRGGGTDRQLPSSQASGGEAQPCGDTFGLHRSYQRASCMRTALLQRAGEEQSQVQASGTSYCMFRNSTRRQTPLNATKMLHPIDMRPHAVT